MLISCKCLNFIATSNNEQMEWNGSLRQASPIVLQQHQLLQPAPLAVVTTADSKGNNATAAAVAMQQLTNDCNSTIGGWSSNNNANLKLNKNDDGKECFPVTNALRQSFLKIYPRNFIFYSQCVDFFKQAIGPVHDLTISVLNQKDLIYSFTLEIKEVITSSQAQSSWQLSICSNCSAVLFAKHLNINSPQFLINCGLLTNNEELAQKRSDKSFSDTFGLLIMDHPKLEINLTNQNQNNSNNLPVASLSTSFAMSSVTSQHLDSKQLRLRQLQANLQQRLQREIAETDERIQRYTSQQFALLKSFREKSEQEYQMLVSLIQCIPEQQANEWLERQPPALDVSNNSVNLLYGGARRRNTISSRRELNNTLTTPTATKPPNTIINTNIDNYVMTTTLNSSTSAITTTTTSNTSGNNTPTPGNIESTADVASFITPTITGNILALNRKMSNFDTPPATPESIPMSVGNSPTLRRKQQQFTTTNVETSDDCLFELEGVDDGNIHSTLQQQQIRTINLQNPSSLLRVLHSQQQAQNEPLQILSSHNNYHRNYSYINAQPGNHMSDSDKSDDAEEAEDALDLDTSMPIATPHRRMNVKNVAQVPNFAKSLPIDISSSPIAVGGKYATTLEAEEDELDNNVDIAASIKALAKSVHGETVFGDLPRPRLRSQI